VSLDLTQSLNSLAMGQAMLVAPPLGESYTGKTAGSIAFLLFLLANGMEERLARRPAFTARLEALLADAPPAARADSGFAEALAAVTDADGAQRFDRLMGALAALHAWADSADTACAARCRDFLADWADSEALEIPVLPADLQGEAQTDQG
jgi:hypothetical protein